MKILLIHNYYRNLGGEETYINNLQKLLTEKSHKIVKFEKNNREINTFFKKIKTSLELFYSKSMEKELKLLIEKEKPDLAHIFNIFPLITPTVYFLCKKYNIPIIQRISSYKYLCPKGNFFRKNDLCFQCLDKKFKYPSIIYGCYANSRIASFFFSSAFYFHKEVIKNFDLVDFFYFPTHFVRNFYIQYANIEPKKTAVIPTFTMIDFKTDSNILNSNKKLIKIKNKYFLFVGRLTEEKGIVKLIQAFKYFKDQKLIIIGEGALENFVKKESSINNNIIYLSHQPREVVLNYIKYCKALIIPSICYDVLPNVFLEGLFLNKPIILSDIPSLSFIKSGKGIIKFKSNDVFSLKKSIIKIIKDKLDAKELRVVYKDIKNEFSAQNHYQRLISLYKEL